MGSSRFFIFKFNMIHFDIFFDLCTLLCIEFYSLAPSFDQSVSNASQSPFIYRYDLFTSRSIGPSSYQKTGNHFLSTQALSLKVWTLLEIGRAQILFRDFEKLPNFQKLFKSSRSESKTTPSQSGCLWSVTDRPWTSRQRFLLEMYRT